MGVYLRGTSWCYRFECRGIRYRVTVGPSDIVTKTQAKVAERLARAKALAHTLPPVRQRTPLFRAFVADFLAHALTRRKPSSYARAVEMVAHFTAFFGAERLDEITPLQVERYKQARAHAGLAPSTINLELRYLRHLFTTAILWGKTLQDPTAGVPRYRDLPKHLRWLTPTEAAALLAACAPPLRLLVLVALHTGLRKGELLSLRWGSVDLARRELTVQASYAKTGKTRTVPLSGPVTQALQALGTGQALGTAPVFLNTRGGRYRKPDAPFQAAVRRAGIAPCRFHDLRHTFASRLVQAGTSLQVVQVLLGHTTITHTQVYAHLAPHQTRQAMAIFDRPATCGSH